MTLTLEGRRRPRASYTHAIVVGSGKGGVGKSVVSILLAAALAAQYRRVLLFDGDSNLGNLHVLLGVRPAVRIDALLMGEVAPRDMVQPIAPNLWLMPGESGTESLHGLPPIEQARLQHQLSELYADFDAVVIDAGAGIESVMRVAMMRATRLLVVTAPEPTALTDAYALMKIVNMQLPDMPLDILVNRCLDDDEGRDAFVKLATACERFLRRGVRHVGSLPEDPALRASVRDPHRLLETIHATPAAQMLKDTVLDRLDLPEAARSVG